MNNLIGKIFSRDSKDIVVLKNIIISFIIRFLALMLALIKMPLYINFFNNEDILGIWFTILSILTWIFNFDLGIGNGLRNNLVKEIELKNDNKIKEYTSSAYISIFVLIMIIGLIGIIIIPLINWNKFFNIAVVTISNNVLKKTMYIVLVGLLLQFFLKLINSVMYALQKSFIPGLLNFISELVLLIIICTLDNKMVITEKLPIIAVFYSLCTCIPLLIANVITFNTILKKAKPSIKSFTIRSAKVILLIGGMFFWIQIMYMIIVNTNEYLITWFVGPKYVVEYQIYNKLFSLIGTLFTLLLAPIWSMVTKALVSKDYKWIKVLYARLKTMTLVAVLCEFLLIVLLQFLINIWLKGNAINVNYYYALLFAISGSLLIWNGVISTIVNGIGELKIQFITLTIGVCLNIPLAYLFCNLFNGWIGVVLANIISFIPYCIIQPMYINKYFNQFN